MELNEVDPRDYVQFELTEKPDAAPRAKGFILNVEYVDGQTNAIPVDSPAAADVEADRIERRANSTFRGHRKMGE
jgi:hypothetical protein